MNLNNDHRKKLAVFYFFCFAAYYGWFFFNGILLHQLQPVFFHNHLDLTANIIWMTNLQNDVLHSCLLDQVLDGLFIALPVAMCLSVYLGFRIQNVLAMITALFNLVYAVLLSSVSVLSIEGFTGWMLLPMMFAFRGERSFYFALQCMRYFFIIMFFSAGLWKIRAGGIFNIEQMSAILVNQHAAYLVSDPGDWFARFIQYLIIHKYLSYAIYFLATLSELIFVVGFFTKRWDRLLIILFIVFVVLDYFLMRINYFSWVPFLGCLWYGRLKCKTIAS